MIRVLVTLALCLPAVAARAGEVHVLAINGGGDQRDNFASHLSHLRQLVDYLGKAGIPPARITILSGDGADPRPDLAVRDPEPEGTWLLEGTREGEVLRDLDTYENSTLAGFTLLPATRPVVTRVFAGLKARLRPGDTLLLYVTDHGIDSGRDPLDNQIVLWGPRGLSARALGKLLGTLPAEVRVVSLMSQCFSGGFAYLDEIRDKRGRYPGNTCGYFSSTPDRPAYGCYPEGRGRKAVGHSFEFLSALAPHGRFRAAHDAVLVRDDTPDVPLTTSDVYLAEQLAAKAGHPRREPAVLDELLARARQAGQAGEYVALAQAIATRFGIALPATFAELDERLDALARDLDEWQANVKAWTTAIGEFNQGTLRAFRDAHPDWTARLALPALGKLSADGRRERLRALLDALVPFVERNPARVALARHLVAALDTLDTLAYRAEIRIAVLLRIRFVYTRAAGQQLAADQPALAKTVRALAACEDLRLPLRDPAPAPPPLVAREPFPDPAADEKLAATFRPSWLGVAFIPVTPDRRKRLGLPPGAALVTRVLPRSPAQAAGLRVGDIVTGVRGQPLEQLGDLRPLIATSPTGQALALELRRGGKDLTARPEPRPAPAP